MTWQVLLSKEHNEYRKTTYKKQFKMENKPKNNMSIQTDRNTVDDQLNRLIALSETEEEDELISLDELEESEAAWQDYLSGQALGESLDIIRQELLKYE